MTGSARGCPLGQASVQSSASSERPDYKDLGAASVWPWLTNHLGALPEHQLRQTSGA